MSLLNAMILGDLEGLENVVEMMQVHTSRDTKDFNSADYNRGLDFAVLDISAFSAGDLETVYAASTKVEVVYHWLEA